MVLFCWGATLLEQLKNAYASGQLQFFGDQQTLKEEKCFADWIKPLGKIEWVVYAKRPFAGPAAVLAYLSRYNHRVAIANSRLILMDEKGVTFKWKDYRTTGQDRYKTMTLTADEFIRCFLIHILPSGFHRIRHYGLVANAKCKDNLVRARQLLKVSDVESPVREAGKEADKTESGKQDATYLCPHCGTPP